MKKRQSDLSVVEVDILRGANATITSGQLAVMLYQAQAATETVPGASPCVQVFIPKQEI